MATPTDLTAQLALAGLSPASASADGMSATQQDLAKLILLQQFLQGQGAVGNANRGLRFSKLLPPSAMSDQGGTLPNSSNGYYGNGGGW